MVEKWQRDAEYPFYQFLKILSGKRVDFWNKKTSEGLIFQMVYTLTHM